MNELITANLDAWVAPDPPVELVCTLGDHADLLGHRLVVRRTFEGEARDYHLAIGKSLARAIDRLFTERPFKRLRRLVREQVAVAYGGIADPERGEIYWILTLGRSRLKRRMRVQPFVMMELAWVANLTEHHAELGRPVIEA